MTRADDLAPSIRIRNKGASTTDASPFRGLENYVRRLQRLLAVMLGVVIVVPASILCSVKIAQFHEHAETVAGHIARHVSLQTAEQGASLPSLVPTLREEMENNEILMVQFVGMGGEEILRLGEPKTLLFPLRAEAQIAPPVEAASSVTVLMDLHPLILHVGRVVLIHLSAGLMLALVIYAFPMQALRRAIEDVEKAQAQIIHSDKLSALGEVSANLAHEINSPLGILLTRVKLILHSARDRQFPPGLVRDLEVIERHGHRIEEVLRGLLSFARKSPLEFELTDVNQVIHEALALVRKPFAKDGIEIRTLAAPGLPAIWGSPNHLQHVFINLLNNARDALPTGGEITVRALSNNGHVVVEVQDNGAGIAEDIRTKIFDPFFTTKGAGKGTGLGLAVSCSILKEHGGEIEVKSAPGNGATFRLTFPVPT